MFIPFTVDNKKIGNIFGPVFDLFLYTKNPG